MAFKKRQFPKRVSAAQNRLKGIRSVDEEFDIGNGLSATAFDTEISKAEKTYDEYNKLLAQLDGLSTELKQQERIVNQLSQRMLSAVGCKYGYDSPEYKTAGGTPKSEKKRPAKKNTNTSKA